MQDAAQPKPDSAKELQPSRLPEPARDSSGRLDEGAGPSRPSTPRAGVAQTNPESRSHKLPDRPTSHALPTRPDVPIPGHGPAERYGQPRSGVDRRDGRELRAPRDDREAWDGREAKEHREPREVWPQEPERAGRAPAYTDRRAGDATGEGSRVDLPPRPGQHERERQYRDPRVGGMQIRHSDAQGHLHGPSPILNEPSGSTMNADRVVFYAQDGQDRPVRAPDADRQPRVHHRLLAGDPMEAGNSERNALMEDRKDGTSFSQPRPRRDDGHERAPRAPSPRRISRHGQEHGSFEDRHGRPYGQEQRALGRDPLDRSPMVGHGYRGDRPMDREAERGMDKMRDPSAGFHRLGARGLEQLEHRMAHHEQNYGRLNPVPPGAEVPSGPRGRGRGTTRGGYVPHSSTPGRADGRFGGAETARPLSPDRLPPTGPGSGRGRHSGYEPGSGPGTPLGAHGGPPSERVRNYGGVLRADTQTPTSSAATTPSVVHPDRLVQMGPGLPSVPPGAAPQGHGRLAGVGERVGSNARPPPPIGMGPPPSSEAAPMGPSSSSERTRSGGGRRQLAGINSMLQQSQSTPDMRGDGPRGGQPRQLLGNSDAQVLTGGSPVHERQDMMWQDGAHWGPANGGDGGARRERDNRNERLGRSSRRSSREREAERSPRGSRGMEAHEQGEYRDRRSMGNVDVAVKERRMGREGGGRGMMGQGPPGCGRDMGAAAGAAAARHGSEGGFGVGGGATGRRAGEEWGEAEAEAGTASGTEGRETGACGRSRSGGTRGTIEDERGEARTAWASWRAIATSDLDAARGVVCRAEPTTGDQMGGVGSRRCRASPTFILFGLLSCWPTIRCRPLHWQPEQETDLHKA